MATCLIISVTCRFYFASPSTFAIVPTAHCPGLP
jgi:hypothetical protein